MGSKGFFKMDRDVVDHWIFKDPDFRIWVYLIRNAQFENQDKPIDIGNQERYLQRGEFLTSMEKIATDLKVDKGVVRRVLDKLKKNNMIKKTVGRGKGIPYVAKIVNYDKWQGQYTFKKQSKDNQKTFKTQYYNNGNNGNNVDNEKEIYIYQCEVHKEVYQESEYLDMYIPCPKCDLPLTRYKKAYFDELKST